MIVLSVTQVYISSGARVREIRDKKATPPTKATTKSSNNVKGGENKRT